MPIKRTPSGAYQLRVEHKLLSKPYYCTFATYEEAEQYGRHLRKVLALGIVPGTLDKPKDRQPHSTLPRCIAEYLRNNAVPSSDIKLLDTLRPDFMIMTTAMLNYAWAEAWVTSMKREGNLVPSTIRHRTGALARCLDWVCHKHPEILVQNPLRLLKRGFSTYSDADAEALAAKGLSPREDIERNRRLAPDEEAAIVRTLDDRPTELLFFTLALESAMRMRELYTLHVDQVSVPRQTAFLERSKNGDTRQVPLTSVACKALAAHLLANATEIRMRDGRLFPYWSGSRKVDDLDATTSEVSTQFSRIFHEARLVDFHFHDLRHEATCRLYEHTTLTDVLISRITGHRDIRMLKRYASLRGSELAARLW